MPLEAEIPLPVLVRYFRVPTRDIPIDYPGREMLLGSAITNLSLNGVFVRTASPLSEGTRLDVTFHLPGVKRTIAAKTLVRWSAPAASGRRGEPVGMGLEFTKIAKVDHKAVEHYVRAFIERMRGDGR